jgi:hypothetical protein
VWRVEGPVQAEVYVLRMAGGPELTGPDGPIAWYLEVGEDEDPMEVVNRLATAQLGPPLLVHSTSWRRARGAVILSFLVVLRDGQGDGYAGIPIGRAELARNSTTGAAASIATSQVVEHGLRHLAWLAKEDEVVRTALSPAWHELLAGYVPEPFRHLP